MAPETSRPVNLLLLPPSPHPPSWDNLKAAYEAPLKATLEQLAFERRQQSSGSVLEIALPSRVVGSNGVHGSRGSLYHEAQKLVSRVYKLICVIAARDSINVEDIRGIDVRVLLLAYPGTDGADGDVQDDPISIVPQLHTLASSRRPWTHVFCVESEEGEKLLHDFLVSQDDHMKVKRVPGGVVQVSKDHNDIQSQNNPSEEETYSSIAVGGTFDHIHIGHKLLLTMFAFLLQPASTGGGQVRRTLTIGITGDELLKKKKYPELLESWDERQARTFEFLQSILDFRPRDGAEIKSEYKSDPAPNGHAVVYQLGDDLKINCVKLSDPFGPTITDEDIAALVISAETREGGRAINDKRREKGWSELSIFEVDVLDPREDSEGASLEDTITAKLSSTTIRQMLKERAEES